MANTTTSGHLGMRHLASGSLPNSLVSAAAADDLLRDAMCCAVP
jgi:hypothetical protein